MMHSLKEKCGPLRPDSDSPDSSADLHRGSLLDLLFMGVLIPLPIVAMIFATIFFDSKDTMPRRSRGVVYQVKISASSEMAYEGSIRSDHPRNGLTIQDISGQAPQLYRIPSDHAIECSIRKKSGSPGQLHLELIKDGKLLSQDSTTDGFDKITVRVE
jgi:hypothetical protein